MSLQPRVKPRSFETLSKGSRYTVANLRAMDFTEDAILHWTRYHWPVLLSLHETDEEMLVILCDLTAAIKALPPEEKKAVTLLVRGWEVRGDAEHSLGAQMGMTAEEVSRVLKSGYRHMAAFLGGRHAAD